MELNGCSQLLVDFQLAKHGNHDRREIQKIAVKIIGISICWNKSENSDS